MNCMCLRDTAESRVGTEGTGWRPALAGTSTQMHVLQVTVSELGNRIDWSQSQPLGRVSLLSSQLLVAYVQQQQQQQDRTHHSRLLMLKLSLF